MYIDDVTGHHIFNHIVYYFDLFLYAFIVCS